MFIHWTFFLSCGLTQNENKIHKKTFYIRFWIFSFWQCKGRPTRYELGPATWDLTCDLGGGTWLDMRLDPSRLETFLRLAFKDLRLTCDLTLATCKHLWLTEQFYNILTMTERLLNVPTVYTFLKTCHMMRKMVDPWQGIQTSNGDISIAAFLLMTCCIIRPLHYDAGLLLQMQRGLCVC